MDMVHPTPRDPAKNKIWQIFDPGAAAPATEQREYVNAMAWLQVRQANMNLSKMSRHIEETTMSFFYLCIFTCNYICI